MLQRSVSVLLLIIATIEALPIANVRVKFISRPHVEEHDLTTDGDRTIYQKSYVSIGRRSVPSASGQFGQRLRQSEPIIRAENAEALWPVGVFLPPIDINDLGYSFHETGKHMTPDFSNGLGYHDPLLLTGKEAMMAVKYIYGRGELFYDDYPHVRALLRNQEERRLNGLHDHILHSLRPSSPFFKSNQN